MSCCGAEPAVVETPISKCERSGAPGWWEGWGELEESWLGYEFRVASLELRVKASAEAVSFGGKGMKNMRIGVGTLPGAINCWEVCF